MGKGANALIDEGDGNEACCGACRSGGDLICCEGCPASFHAECAGYSNDEVPDGDWYCWFCAKEHHKAYQHPKAQFEGVGGLVHIFLATDDRAEVFRRTTLVRMSNDHAQLAFADVQAANESVHRSSPRLWHGTVNKAAWTLDPDGVHWRPNSRLYKIDKAALAADQAKRNSSHTAPHNGVHKAHTNSNAPPAAAAAAGSGARTRLKLHIKGINLPPQRQQAAAAGGQQQQQQQQGVSGEREGESVPPSPAPSPSPVGECGGLLSPDGSAGGAAGRGSSPGAASGGSTAGMAAALASAAARGVTRVPAGMVGAGLPAVQGGADSESFDAALKQYWAQRASSGAKVPAPMKFCGVPVDPYAFWREVWAWGGPDEINKSKLWATIGHSFNPPSGSTSISSRVKSYYDSMLAAFDEARGAGEIQLQHPIHNRQPSDRLLQIRGTTGAPSLPPSSAPGAAASGASKRNRPSLPALMQPGGASSGGPLNAPSPTSSTAVAAASAEGPLGPAGAAAAAAGRKRPPPRQRSRTKRKRAGVWSDDDEGDVIHAEDVESDEFDAALLAGSSEEGEQQQQQEEVQRRELTWQQHKRVLEQQEASSSSGLAGGSPSKASSKKLRLSMASVKAELVAGGINSAGAYEYLRQPTDLVVLGKIRLTPAAQQIKVGDCVDFREPVSSGRCVTGWRSGTVLAIAPGSEWEGGRRLLIKPRHTHSHSHDHRSSSGSQQPSLPPDSPAAAALAALAAAGGGGGGPISGAAAAKLLTPSGHLRHEVAGLLPARSGSLKPGALGDNTPPPPAPPATHAAVAGGGGEGPDAARWLPMVWRGDSFNPFLAPPVLVRPHYTPKTTLAVDPSAVAAGGRGGGGGAGSSARSPFAAPQQQQQQQQVDVQAVRVDACVEVLREGYWCPARVLEVVPGGGGGGSSSGSSRGGCVVVHNMEPPEADGGVWRCSGTHNIRPMHPRYTSGCGVVQCDGPDELITVQAMKKALAPYMYTGGIHAFACMEHMRAAANA